MPRSIELPIQFYSTMNFDFSYSHSEFPSNRSSNRHLEAYSFLFVSFSSFEHRSGNKRKLLFSCKYSVTFIMIRVNNSLRGIDNIIIIININNCAIALMIYHTIGS